MELNRLPELFCGFHQRSNLEGPTLYPVACSPQAWAAGSAYQLLESCLGITLQPGRDVVQFSLPELPALLEWIELKNLYVGGSTIDLRLEKNAQELSIKVLRNTNHEVKIQIEE
jgi:glycogen debranching enzyme